MNRVSDMKGEPMNKEQAIELLEHLAWDREIDRNPYGDALNMAIDALKAQLSKEGTTSDLISRQAVINAIENTNAKMSMPEWDEITNAVMSLPIIQPEPAILVTWIDKYIEWLKSFDNEFANLEAAHISVMVKKWRGGAE